MKEQPTDVEPWIEYVQRHARGAKQEDIADKIGLNKATISRWKDPDVQPRAEHVVTFARKDGRAPIEALIHAGYIKPEEVGKAIETATSMRDVSDAAILGELDRRLAEFRRLLAGSNDAEGWSTRGWSGEDTGMGRVQDGDEPS